MRATSYLVHRFHTCRATCCIARRVACRTPRISRRRRTRSTPSIRKRCAPATAGRRRVDFPFFKIDTGRGSVVIAVGWSGCWQADAVCPVDRNVRLTAGIEKTHFLLHPGEKVRMPRMLALFWEGDV